MLDTSGAPLHKRGYRQVSTLAPIKETLAAAIIDLGRIYPDTLAQDPFCGSGTLMIEAAMKAMNMAPGLRRRFTAEHYAFLPAAVWKEQREKALSEIRRGVEFQGVGFDIDPAAVALAAANAKLAGVEKHCRFFTADVKDFSPAPAQWCSPIRLMASAWETLPPPRSWSACWAVGWRKPRAQRIHYYGGRGF